MAETIVTMRSFPSSKPASISLPRSLSGSLTSSLELPSPSIKLRKPCHVSQLPCSFSHRSTHVLNVDELVLGTADVGHIHVVGLGISSESSIGSWIRLTEGEMSSIFLPVKI